MQGDSSTAPQKDLVGPEVRPAASNARGSAANVGYYATAYPETGGHSSVSGTSPDGPKYHARSGLWV